MKLAAHRGFDTTVYEPAEDSDLLAQAAIAEIDAGARVLDVGTGSGYVAGRIAEAVGAHVVTSDVNPHACERARDRGLPTVRANLTDAFAAGAFDAVTFNPPYLPIPPDKERSDWFDRAISGGTDGRSVIEPFLAGVGRVVASGGFVLLLASTLSDVDAICEFAGEHGWSVVALRDVAFPGETLTVLKLVR